jgi:DNA polymerase-3 subunit alpha
MNTNYEWSDLHVTEILSETYGLLIFQETFYRLFNEIAGISIADTDKWRVKMFKGKQKVELDTFNDLFITGCRNNSSLNEKEISMLLNLINRSFLFTFLKAHSFSYSTVAYWGAYYKKYHRKVFDEVFEDYMQII